MHNFIVHSNESACRKMDVLGWTKSFYQWNHPQMTSQSQEHTWKQTVTPTQSPQDVHLQPYGIFLSWEFGPSKNNE